MHRGGGARLPPQLLGRAAVLQRIFDPRGYDFYQGRELSYAIDFLDAQWVRQLLARDVLFFVPPSALARVARGRRDRAAARARARCPASPRPTAWLVLLVYLSNFAVASTTGLLYRATKPLVAPLLLVLLLLGSPSTAAAAGAAGRLRRGLRAGPRDEPPRPAGALLPPALRCRVLGAAWLRTRRGLALVLGAAAAVAAWAAYNYALGPWRHPRVERLLAGDALPAPAAGAADAPGALARGRPAPGRLDARAVRRAPAPPRGRGRGRPRRLGAGASGASRGASPSSPWPRRGARRPRSRWSRSWSQRHAPVTWIDHRFWYYPLPFQALLVVRPAVGPRARGARARGVAAPRRPARPRRPRRRERRPVAGAPAGHAVGPLVRRRRAAVRPARPLAPRGAARARSSTATTGGSTSSASTASPCPARPRRAQVGEGSGVDVAAFEGGGVQRVGPARVPPRGARQGAGAHVLAGAVVLRPGDALRSSSARPPAFFEGSRGAVPTRARSSSGCRAALPEGPSEHPAAVGAAGARGPGRAPGTSRGLPPTAYRSRCGVILLHPLRLGAAFGVDSPAMPGG